jgi:hypothetical protein
MTTTLPQADTTMQDRCHFDPRSLKGLPIGMLHCPECGEMVMAGLEHPIYDYAAEDASLEEYWREKWLRDSSGLTFEEYLESPDDLFDEELGF